MQNPDMYEVEVEAGRMGPIPEYVNEWLVARWMGVTIDQLQDMNAGDVAKAQIVMAATNQAQHAANQKASKR